MFQARFSLANHHKEDNMIKGHVKCECGQEFWFETIMETIACIKCGKEYKTADHGEEVIDDPPQEE